MKKKMLWRREPKTKRDKVWHAILDYPFFPIQWDSLDTPMASNFWAAANGISEEDFLDPDLERRDPKKYHFLWEEPLGPRPGWFFEAINDPKCAPAIAALILRVNGRTVTYKALARALGMSVKRLYHEYGAKEIRRVCKESPTRVLQSVGKKNRKSIIKRLPTFSANYAAN
jgi:hypothetical protein